MRVALISDLHANALALERVLADIRHTGVDRIVCLGDVATLGPDPHTVLAMLQGLGCSCILGNHDEFLLEPELIHTYTEAPIIVEAVDWCRAQLSEAELAFVRSFERSRELALGAIAKLFLFHGSPRSHMENLLATTPPEELEALLGPHRASVMAGGHTHIQMLRQHRGSLLLNPGSVGLPFKEFVAGGPPTLLPHAEYAVVEERAGVIDVSLRRVELDQRALRAAAERSDNPFRAALLAQYQ
jgi:putative phosphoesterase